MRDTDVILLLSLLPIGHCSIHTLPVSCAQ